MNRQMTRPIVGFIGLLLVVMLVLLIAGSSRFQKDRKILYLQKTSQDIPKAKPYKHIFIIPPYY